MEKTPKMCKYGEMIDLEGIEEEALAEGREWIRRRIEEKLRERAAAFSPGRRKKAQRGPTPEADGKNHGR